VPGDKRLLALAIACFAVIFVMGVLVPKANAGLFQSHTVEVNGYSWTSSPLKVPINEGTTYTSLQVLQANPDKVDIDTLPDISVNLPGSSNAVKCTGDQVRNKSNKCPTFAASSDYTTMSFVKDGETQEVRYQATTSSGGAGLTPQIFIGQTQTLSVDLSPPSKKIDSGDTVTFKASVTGASGNVTYAWDFGDGSSKTTSQATVSHKFTGNNQT
jgi:hypothetical protein